MYHMNPYMMSGVTSPYYPVGADCVGYWDFGDGLESAVDHSIYGNDGTIVGAAFVEGGIQLDGSDDIVTIVDNSEMDIGTGSWSWLAWVKPATTGALQRFISSNYGAGIWFYSLRISASGTNIYGTIYDDAWAPYYQATADGRYTVDLFDGNSHLIGYICDRVTPTAWLVVDGTLYQTVSLEGTTAGSITTTTHSFSGIPSAPTNGPYKGILHEAIMWNTLKDQDDVTDYFDATKARYA